MMMKKLFLLFLGMVLAFSFTGCGGTNDNDANNAIIQAKIDEASSLTDQFVNWYKDNGFLEGPDAATIQPLVDQMTEQIEVVKAAHQENLDAGGYSDDIVTEKAEAFDKIITGIKAGIEGQAAYVAE